MKTMTRGGKRPGAGRPSMGQRQQTTIYLDKEQIVKLQYIKFTTGISINQQITTAINNYLKKGIL